MNPHHQGALILIKVHKLHLIIAILLDPLVHFLLDLGLILFILLGILGKVEEGQLALLVLPIGFGDIDGVLLDVHALVDVLVEQRDRLEEFYSPEVADYLHVLDLFQLVHCHL